MRIVCPACNAQYEIADDLLPEEGREVQCSACGTVWFQERRGTNPRVKPALAPSLSAAATMPPETAVSSAQVPLTDPPQAGDAEAGAADLPAHTQDGEPADTAISPNPDPEHESAATLHNVKPPSPETLDILRKEAEFEARQRAREANRLESQPDLGLLGAAPWPSNPRDDAIAAESAPSDPAQARDAPKGAAFPDIEDISASLDPISSARGRSGASGDKILVPPTSAERNASFIRGLIMPLAVALVLVALYLIAPVIGSAVPALTPVTSGYVNAVDGLRITLAGLLGR